MDDSMLFDLNAASWRHGHADEVAFVEALATRLEKSLLGLVEVERDHKLFAKSHHVVKIQVHMDTETFVLELENSGRFASHKAKAVRGVVLSKHAVPLKEWLAELSEALNRYAHENEEARQSLEEFLL